MENRNPGSSIKDRVALKIIEDAEKSGELNKNATIVEATAGNTGLGLTLIAKLKGYKAKVVILDKMNENKILKLIKINIDKNKSYNHLFRLALNNNIISVSLRDRLRPKNNFILKLVNYERVRPEHKNLKYKLLIFLGSEFKNL